MDYGGQVGPKPPSNPTHTPTLSRIGGFVGQVVAEKRESEAGHSEEIGRNSAKYRSNLQQMD
jgi:hypothetical protein